LNVLPRADKVAFQGHDRQFGLCKTGNDLIFFRDESADACGA
jgi:hypothetical protein